MKISEAWSLLQDKFMAWIQSLIVNLPNFVIAFVVVFVANKISIHVRKLVVRILRRFISNAALINFLATLSRVAVLFLGVLLAIKILKLDEAIFSLLAGVGILGLALGFAFQDIAANFIAGIALVFHKEHPFQVDDIVETNDIIGKVKEINIRDTMIETFQGQTIFIPNKSIFENPVINYSILGKRRIDLSVGISYGDDLQKVKKITVEAIEKIEKILSQQPIKFYYEKFGDSSVNFIVCFWVAFKEQSDYLFARSDAIMRIHQAYKENNICIPFPIRTLDFGIKGGEKLSAMLNQSRI